ncbi:MAG: hypothetical protein HOO06_03935 [Bdellovibrionaceae bacterium]|nr:hypothetical protein [Pseudobdellovibrionaceae bacterium]
MSEWRTRAEIKQDVAFFSYTDKEKEIKTTETYIWDLDKTYLDTKFESVKGLIRAAMEPGRQKRNIPGTGELVRSLKDFNKTNNKYNFAFYFITASPPQIEKKIIEKLNFDDIYPQGIFCKDNMQNLKPKRLWRLTKQVGFKLQSLMQLRKRLPDDVKQVLWGDDSESDAIIYSLYSDICTQRLQKDEITKILKSFHVTGKQVDTILELALDIPKHDPVEKIYINLEIDTDAEYYIKFGRRILPTFNSFQTVLDLYQDGRLYSEHVIGVARALMDNYEFTSDELEKSFDDLVRRQVLSEETVEGILPELQGKNIIHKEYLPSITPKKVLSRVNGKVYELEGHFEPWVPERIEYLHNYR